MWRRIHLEEEKIHLVFDTLDVEGRGFLTIESIQNAVGMDFTSEQVRAPCFPLVRGPFCRSVMPWVVLAGRIDGERVRLQW